MTPLEKVRQLIENYTQNLTSVAECDERIAETTADINRLEDKIASQYRAKRDACLDVQHAENCLREVGISIHPNERDIQDSAKSAST